MNCPLSRGSSWELIGEQSGFPKVWDPVGDASYFKGEASRISCLSEHRQVRDEEEGCNHPKPSSVND